MDYHSNLIYPADSTYASSSGYFNSLDADQSEILLSLQKWIIKNNIEISQLSLFTLHPTLLLLRYLRANNFILEKTIVHIESSIRWREEMNIKSIVDKSPEDILKIKDISEITNFFPHWHCGYDKLGRPVIYKQYGGFEVWKLLKLTTIDALMKYHIWEQEACMEMCKRQSIISNHIVETITAVIDVKGMVLSQVTSDFLKIVKGIAQIDQVQYPETLGRFFIINTPSVFPIVWRGIKMFLDPIVASKIEIFGCKEAEWKKRLIEYIGEDNLPQNYGGSCSILNMNKHPYEEIINLRHLDKSLVQERNVGKADQEILTIELSLDEEAMPPSPPATPATPLTPKLDKEKPDEILNNSDSGKQQHEAGASTSYPSYPTSLHLDPNKNSAIYKGWNQEITFMNHIIKTKIQKNNNKSDSLTSVAKVYEWPTVKIFRFLKFSIVLHMLITLGCIIMCSVDLSSMFQNNTYILAEMWSSILILFTSFFVEICSFAGYFAIIYYNRQLLLIYICSSTVMSLLLFSMSLVTFLQAANVNISYLPEGISPTQMVKQIWEYNILLGISCVLVLSIGLIPLILSYIYEKRVRQDLILEQQSWYIQSKENESDEKLKTSLNQLRVVIKFISYVGIIFSILMLAYGTYALRYLNALGFTGTSFEIFGSIYSGVLVMLVSILGIWSSRTRHRFVVLFYHRCALLVLVAVLLFAAQKSFVGIYGARNKVENALSNEQIEYTGSLDLLNSEVLSQLLVTGVMCTFVCLSQIIPIIITRQLEQRMSIQEARLNAELDHSNGKVIPYNMIQTKQLSQTNSVNRLSFWDKFRVVWGVLLGLYSIFYNGTFVVFSFWPESSHSSNELSVAWRQMSNFDARYYNNDSFLVSTSAISAIIAGPLVLYYAYAIVEGSPFRYIAGIVSSILYIHSEILYYAIEMHVNFKDISFENSTLFILMFILIDLIHIVIPSFVLWSEFVFVNERIDIARKYDKSVFQNIRYRPVFTSSPSKISQNKRRNFRKNRANSRNIFYRSRRLSQNSTSMGSITDSMESSKHDFNSFSPV